ncbi:MAG: TonB-dependent receptor, partial [Candidatus Korobacteraceae bacterium]
VAGAQTAPGGPQAAPQTGGAQPAGEAPASAPRSLGGATSLAKALNPDISMIGDFLGSAGGNSPPLRAQQTQFRSLELHESELGVQAIVDPYARADFFLTFGEEGVGVEEGYITFTSLPAGFVAKVGKMRAAFGKVNTMHNHVMPWADRPLVTDNLVGGEDGINDAGFSVTRNFAGPKKIFLEATGQLFRGDSGDPLAHPLFASGSKSGVSTVAHLRGYRDITESTNLDLGVSFARGHSDLGNTFLANPVPNPFTASQVPLNVDQAFPGRSFITYLYGVDATVRWKPLRRSIYHSFIARSELIWNQRQQLNSLLAGGAIPTSPAQYAPATKRSFGFYVSADYQLARRWFIGGRYDSSQRSVSAGTDNGTSLVVTYWPSEFLQLRGQYRSTRYAEGRNANELLTQIQFVLGAHGAHPF